MPHVKGEMAKVLQVSDFLEKSKSIPVIDVRSPGEYGYAHIPGALSLALFSDEERAAIGTLYKRSGRIKAVQKGLDFVGPKLAEFTKYALSLKCEELLLHCWRGGMRSSSMAWLLERVGIECYLLENGYKSYRNHILSCFEKPLKIILLGGYTGSGKTDLLHLLEESGEQVLDLERLANHKGSAFGALGEGPQPGTEFFENLIFDKLSALDQTKSIWIEDEGRSVGRNTVPTGLWQQMRDAPLVQIEVPFEIRLKRLLRDYGNEPREELVNSIQKIEKRLGFDNCKAAVEACLSGDIGRAAEICLIYYDRAYAKKLTERFDGERARFKKIVPLDKEVSKESVSELLKAAEIFTKD